MATTTIPWGDGSGENIYLTYSSASGNQMVQVTSDANTGNARSKVVTFSTGNISRQLTVNQEAGGPQYVTNGLVFWLDGIDKGAGNTAWVEKINSYSFTNHGATFNADHIAFDGVDDYLDSSAAATYGNASGNNTIEIVYDGDLGSGTNAGLYTPKTGRYMSGIGMSNGVLCWQFGRGSRPMYVAPLSGAASVSISASRALCNGSAMTQSGSNYMVNSDNTSYIGKRSSYFFKGKIYSIRIYNRNLTEAEVLQNLAVDNQRFNLGLTL